MFHMHNSLENVKILFQDSTYVYTHSELGLHSIYTLSITEQRDMIIDIPYVNTLEPLYYVYHILGPNNEIHDVFYETETEMIIGTKLSDCTIYGIVSKKYYNKHIVMSNINYLKDII